MANGDVLTEDSTQPGGSGEVFGVAKAAFKPPAGPSGAAGGSLAGTYPNPSIAAGAVGGTEIAAAIKDPAAGTAGLRTLSNTGTTACAGNDSRLSDSRAPSGAAGGSLAGTYPNPSIAAGAVGGTEIAAAIKDPAAGTAGLRTLSNTGTTACAGNDSRLSDSRAPSGAAGGSLASTYPNPTIAAGAVTGTEIAAAIKDPAAATAGLRTLGTGAAQAFPGNGLTAAAVAAALGFSAIRKIATGTTTCPPGDTYTTTFTVNSGEVPIPLNWLVPSIAGEDFGTGCTTGFVMGFERTANALEAKLFITNNTATSRDLLWLIVGIKP